LRLSKYFGTTAKFWLGLQDDFDLEEEQHLKSPAHVGVLHQHGFRNTIFDLLINISINFVEPQEAQFCW